ncbi:MAG: hypothetical protein AB1489_27270 [Acidobacteriota bacterium]
MVFVGLESCIEEGAKCDGKGKRKNFMEVDYCKLGEQLMELEQTIIDIDGKVALKDYLAQNKKLFLKWTGLTILAITISIITFQILKGSITVQPKLLQDLEGSDSRNIAVFTWFIWSIISLLHFLPLMYLARLSGELIAHIPIQRNREPGLSFFKYSFLVFNIFIFLIMLYVGIITMLRGTIEFAKYWHH